jgi:hypothetical protein
MYCPAGAQQNDAAEQFAVFPASKNMSAGQALQPGTSILIKSVNTGKFCRVVAVGSAQQILCDVEDASGASVMGYTGFGFSYQGQGFANSGSSQPLQVSSSAGAQASLAPSECPGRLHLLCAPA